MRKLAFYVLCILFALPITTEAKVWRVNNNAGVVADFNNLDDAIQAAAAGDTIHLEPSATAYFIDGPNTFATTGRYITIIGYGYLHFNEDGYQQDALQSMIGTSNAAILITSKIKFIGVTFNSPIELWRLQPRNIIDVTFESCLFNNVIEATDIEQINGLHFYRNYMMHHLIMTLSSSPGTTLNDFSFENNIIMDQFSITTIPVGHDQMIVRNNVFNGDYICVESYCANNIFINGVTTAPSGFTGCILKNNIFPIPVFTTGASVEANNQFDVDMSTVFVNNPAFLDRTYQLLGGSVAVGAGVPNGTTPVDCGAYGGPNPYKPFGMPAIPSIYLLHVPSAVTTGTDMHISVGARSNN